MTADYNPDDWTHLLASSVRGSSQAYCREYQPRKYEIRARNKKGKTLIDCPKCLRAVGKLRGYGLEKLDPHWMPPRYTVTVLTPKAKSATLNE